MAQGRFGLKVFGKHVVSYGTLMTVNALAFTTLQFACYMLACDPFNMNMNNGTPTPTGNFTPPTPANFTPTPTHTTPAPVATDFRPSWIVPVTGAVAGLVNAAIAEGLSACGLFGCKPAKSDGYEEIVGDSERAALTSVDRF